MRQAPRHGLMVCHIKNGCRIRHGNSLEAVDNRPCDSATDALYYIYHILSHSDVTMAHTPYRGVPLSHWRMRTNLEFYPVANSRPVRGSSRATCEGYQMKWLATV